MSAKEYFKNRLIENNFNLTYLLKKNDLNPFRDITAIPDSGKGKKNYRNFRKDVTKILAKTICEYVNEFGAVLRKDINDCFLGVINSMYKIGQVEEYSAAKSTFFVKSIIAPHTEFNSLIYREGIKKDKGGVKKLGMGNEYKVDFSNTKDYSFSTIFYKDETDARNYLFSKFGKVKRSTKINNNVQKIKTSVVKTGSNITKESLEEKVKPVKSIEDMSLKEVLGFESDAEYKKYIKERDELFKKNGNGWWYGAEDRLAGRNSNSKK